MSSILVAKESIFYITTMTYAGIENEGNIMKELKQLIKELNDMIQDLDFGVKQNGDKLDQIIDNQGIFKNFEITIFIAFIQNLFSVSSIRSTFSNFRIFNQI